MTTEQRHHLVSAAILLCALTVAWAVFVGASALVAGVAASSLALIGLGANSLLDGTASAVLFWRFRHERSAPANLDALERRAATAVGAVMIAVGLYLTASAVSALAGHSSPERSGLGIVLAAGSVLVLPLLARAKPRLAAARETPYDGMLSLAGGVLAAATLLSLVLEATLDWWWGRRSWWPTRPMLSVENA